MRGFYAVYLFVNRIFRRKHMKKILTGFSVMLLALSGLVGCTGRGGGNKTESVPDEELTGTAKEVAAASKMTMAELEAASKAEFEANKGETFKVVGLTSVLQKVMSTFAAKYDWVHYKEEGEGAQADNVYVKNDYKDYTLLSALNTAEKSYMADYALVQDVRSFSAYLQDGILHNYVPSDWQELGLKEEDTLPLKGIHFNKLFWTNTNFTNVTGKTLYNIWQLAGTKGDHADHLEKISFQTPVTEQINMSFLVSCYAQDNQKRIEDAYKSYYKKDWSSTKYASAGEQWVDEFLTNITTWHASDGTAMKQTQLETDWKAGVVYYGAFAKMKDAAGKYYAVEGQETDPILKDLIETEGENKGKVNAMKTVKWDWQIEGFNGFMYCMDSQIVNNAKFPYTACLYARVLLEESSYSNAIFNKATPGTDGQKGNQYGYYYPGTASENFNYAAGDWTKEQHIEREINEDYNFLKNAKSAWAQAIIAKIS